ncbi:hypothetical protein CORC01_08906 [Colletotrichum orchidophilum]|uniref:Uncharacterized protein n=1 Tax=Colletotrichum orchidophilum TaxID=1209926 RepID=A0A1G4B368_9PEZI|nr:uncharacterized protein CORC01_08906 [Colletotrichum orchidophilum]OHE95765.1 hypothetical protein CORC01_08906 [Colletotrichum orchidophilum]
MAPPSKAPESASTTTTGHDGDSPVDNIAQAYKDLLRGEQAASALEANLTNLEGRLDALLAAFESAQEPSKDGTVAPPGKGSNEPDSKSQEAAKKA